MDAGSVFKTCIDDRTSSVDYAIDAGSLPIAKSLILSGADALSKSKEGDTAIERAVMRPDGTVLLIGASRAWLYVPE